MSTPSDLINLIRYSVFGGEIPNVEITPVLEALAKRHDMEHLLGGRNSAYYQAQMLCAKQIEALGEIRSALNGSGIDMVPLKGSVLRDYYPEPWMRRCRDIDILVPKGSFGKACEVMESLGFERGGSDVCDVSFNRGIIAVELHFSVSEYREPAEAMAALSGYFGNPDGLFYLHHICHMKKHYELGGCGLKSVLDIAVMKRRGIGGELTDDVKDFAAEMENLAEQWFVRGEYTDSETENYIMNGGAFGTMKQRVAFRSKGKTDSEYLKGRIFMPYEELKFQYPELKDRRWLTPYYEIKRWGRFLSPEGRKRMISELREVKNK